MRVFLLFMAFAALPLPAAAQGIVVPANLEIFDGVSGSLQKERGRLIVDDFYSSVSNFQLQTGGGTVLCSGKRWTGTMGGTFKGKCFGYPATGNYTQSLGGVVRMRWDYKNSWIKLQARVD